MAVVSVLEHSGNSTNNSTATTPTAPVTAPIAPPLPDLDNGDNNNNSGTEEKEADLESKQQQQEQHRDSGVISSEVVPVEVEEMKPPAANGDADLVGVTKEAENTSSGGGADETGCVTTTTTVAGRDDDDGNNGDYLDSTITATTCGEDKVVDAILGSDSDGLASSEAETASAVLQPFSLPEERETKMRHHHGSENHSSVGAAVEEDDTMTIALCETSTISVKDGMLPPPSSSSLPTTNEGAATSAPPCLSVAGEVSSSSHVRAWLETLTTTRATKNSCSSSSAAAARRMAAFGFFLEEPLLEKIWKSMIPPSAASASKNATTHFCATTSAAQAPDAVGAERMEIMEEDNDQEEETERRRLQGEVSGNYSQGEGGGLTVAAEKSRHLPSQSRRSVDEASQPHQFTTTVDVVGSSGTNSADIVDYGDHDEEEDDDDDTATQKNIASASQFAGSGGEGDDADTAATSRSSNPEIEDKELVVVETAIPPEDTLTSTTVMMSADAAPEDGVASHALAMADKVHHWRQLLEWLVVVFPCVYFKNNNDEEEGNRRRHVASPLEQNEIGIPEEFADMSFPGLYATLGMPGIAVGRAALTDSAGGCSDKGLLDLLDELCLHYCKRRFLEDDGGNNSNRGQAAASPSKDGGEVESVVVEKSSIRGTVLALLNALEKAVIRSFTATQTRRCVDHPKVNTRSNNRKKVRDDDDDHLDGDHDVGGGDENNNCFFEDVKRMERLLSQQKRSSSLTLPADWSGAVGEDYDAHMCQRSKSSASWLILMSLDYLRSLHRGEQQQHEHSLDSWKRLNSRIEEVLMLQQQLNDENDDCDHDHPVPEKASGPAHFTAAAVTAAKTCEEADDVTESKIDETHHGCSSREETTRSNGTSSSQEEPLLPSSSADLVAPDESRSGLASESDGTTNGATDNTSSSPTSSPISSKKKKKKKGKKKKKSPSSDSNKNATTSTQEDSAETASNVETKAVKISRIPEQQQSEISNSIAAESDTTTSCQAPNPDAAVLNEERGGDGGTAIPAPVDASEQATSVDSLDKEREEYICVEVAESASSTSSEVLVAEPTKVPALAEEEEGPSRNVVVEEPTKEVRIVASVEVMPPQLLPSTSSEHVHPSRKGEADTTSQTTTKGPSLAPSLGPTPSVNPNADITAKEQHPLPESQQQEQSTQQNNDSEWETVSTRTRGRKNTNHKPLTIEAPHIRGAATLLQQQQQAQMQLNYKNTSVLKDHRHRISNNGTNNSTNSHNNTSQHNHSARRKNNSARKIVREIMFSLLDGVDDEVRIKHEQKQQQAALHSLQPSPWAAREAQQPGSLVKPTVAEVLMSSKKQSLPPQENLHLPASSIQSQQKHQQQHEEPSQPSHQAVFQNPSSNPSYQMMMNKSKGTGKQRYTRTSDSYPSKKGDASPSKMASTAPRSNGLGSPPADQSTAPTYQETLSALSSASNTVENGNNAMVKNKQESSNASGGAQRNHQHALVAKASDGDGSVDVVETDTHPTDHVTRTNNLSPSQSLRSPVPPLPTLLSPENANSTASSVASSLEAPHGRHHNHHAQVQGEHNAVGYHLLDVCDRLSQDIAVFMKSRAQAVSLRRSERAVLLGALQKVVSGIWSNSCRVELYGSCATLLDLPSSDMDVVIIGLDNRSSGVFSWKAEGDMAPRTKSEGDVEDATGYRASSQPPTSGPPPPPYIPVYSANAHRVMRLAGAIERLPWAVQVKSIPHATVPVIKILADPSKIPGFNASNEWLGYGAPAADEAYSGTNSPMGMSTDSVLSAASRPYQPWRGSDLMNGLISLDITFQGPEHGGIGSTDYSWNVVNRVCQEMGIQNPDETPFVQCLMVLKELLVQRKLNEPYSGGLSSYALLLLLTALTRERAAIREELERVEQHRQTATLSSSSASIVASPQLADALPQGLLEVQKRPGHRVNGAETAAPPAPMENAGADSDNSRRAPLAKATSSSWASVARSSEPAAVASSEGSTAGSNTQGTLSAKASSNEQKARSLQQDDRKPISFADVVGKSVPSAVVPKIPAATHKLVSPPKAVVGPWQTKARRDTQGPSDDPALHGRCHIGNSTKRKNSGSHHTFSNSSSSNTASDNGSNYKNNTNEVKGSIAFPESVLMEQQFQKHQQYDPNLVPSFFPQGFDDVIEVLCLGETTGGKLLMHFLLYYGQYFDAATTAIDISGKHERVFNTAYPTPYSYMTPFIERSAPESIDPHTGMLVVDHIVIYDPLEGAEKHNVARRCFAWHQVRWIFAQSYATLSSAVEKSAASRSVVEAIMPNPQNCRTGNITTIANATEALLGNAIGGAATGPIEKEPSPLLTAAVADVEPLAGDVPADLASPLLKCLLSF